MSHDDRATAIPASKLRPRTASEEALARLNEPHEEWPKGLFRFALFKRYRDGPGIRYRSICWNPVDRQLHVLKLVDKGAPTGTGAWEVWSADSADSPLKDIARVDEHIVKDYMELPLNKLPEQLKKALKGVRLRKRIVQAFCFLDVVGKGKKEDFVFNDQVVLVEDARLEAQHFVRRSLGKERGWESYIRKLFHQYCHFAGLEGAMLAQHDEKGGKNEKRTGKLENKPGRLSDEEERAKRRSEATGKPVAYRRKPVTLKDEERILDALKRYWVKHKSLSQTYERMLEDHYTDVDDCATPLIDTFRRHANALIKQHGLLALREGERIHHQYDRARVGTATDYTHGKIEIVDIDGTTANIGVEVKVGGKTFTTYLKVIFAVSRNTHAVLGVEVVQRGESAEAYRRCIASIYLDKKPLAEQLGLDSDDGLLTGNIDGIFLDNGAGASKENSQAACVQMRLTFEIAPPARGDYKGVVENVIGLMKRIFEEEAGGHNRRKGKLEQELRRRARLNRPVPYPRFLRLLWKAIQRHNLTADRSYLRDYKMLDAGYEGTPKELFERFQSKRRGDARKQWTPREVFARFVPWKTYTVRRGVVRFKGSLRYRSDELTAEWNKHIETPKPRRGPLCVKVKRLDGQPHVLIWKKPNGEEGLLQIFPQDARRIKTKTWGEVNMTFEADSIRKKLKQRKWQQRHSITVEQDKGISDAEAVRLANGDERGLSGTSVSDAKDKETAARDREWGERHAEAAGFTKPDPICVPTPQPMTRLSAADDAYAARVRQERAARAANGSTRIS